MHSVDLTLPFNNPVLIFALILFIILFAPIILTRFKIPHLIGLIIAGAVVGPHGMNMLQRDSSVELFGTVGLLYIMFLAGLEIDLADFRKNSNKSITFGMYTFLIPMALGTAAGYYFLDMSLPAAVLLASMFASHTLIAYPIISSFGVTRNRAVNIAVGGTMITDTLALLVLAIVVGMETGAVGDGFWLRLLASLSVFATIVVVGFPIVGRWFFKRFDHNIAQYNFVLGMVFLAGFLAELAGVEAIIGAFLAGLALNRLIPGTSPLMNRIEFVGNALFIPFFLIGVGMLIDFSAFVTDTETIKVAITMTVIANLAKYIAAWLTQKTFNFTLDERRIIFGLSNAQAAATLAAILVGYNVILDHTADGDPVRLLEESVLNGTIMMILVTCTVASFVAQKGAEGLALKETADSRTPEEAGEENILIPMSHIDTAEELVNLSLAIKSKSAPSKLFALNIIDSDSANGSAERQAKKLLAKAKKAASAADTKLKEVIRYDLNTVHGITGIVKQYRITDIIMGLHHKKGITDSFLGSLTEGLLTKCNSTIIVYKSTQPVATNKKTIVVIPEKAELELGFPFWISKVWNLSKNTGSELVFYASEKTIDYLKEIHARFPVEASFNLFDKWEDFLILARGLTHDDNFMVIMSRAHHLSYNRYMKKIPGYLNKYFKDNNFILLYPMQLGAAFTSECDLTNPSIFEPLVANFARLDDLGRTVVELFREKS